MQPQDERHEEFEVDAEGAGQRLDRFLADQLRPEYSRSFLAGLIRDGRVTIGDRQPQPSTLLERGDRVVARLGPPPASAPVPERIPLRILYEDPDLVVVDKPKGLLVHPAGSRDGGTLVNALLERYPEVSGVGVVERPGIVHRLDRYTSGVMVVARSNTSREGLVRQFQERTTKKWYRTVVEGKVTLLSDYIDLPIGPHPKVHDRMRIDVDRGKTASTYFEVDERLGAFTTLKVQPLSGRTHQIRLHLAHAGHPVVGDAVYGRQRAHHLRDLCRKIRAEGGVPPAIDQQMLHAERLAFRHPIDGRQLEFTSPLPEEFQQFLVLLRERTRASS